MDINKDVMRDLEILKVSFPEDVEIFLFGSFCKSKDWNDIDLLFLYSDCLSPDLVREMLSRVDCKYPIHSIFMSREEEIELSFIQTTNARKL